MSIEAGIIIFVIFAVAYWAAHVIPNWEVKRKMLRKEFKK